MSQIEVGPSAPPMMPIDAACSSVKWMPGTNWSSTTAPMSAEKMPSCAAAPRSSIFGLAMSGPKSVMAPTPKKMRIGKRPVSMPAWKMQERKPPAVTWPPTICRPPFTIRPPVIIVGVVTPASGMFASRPPMPIGKSSRGSKPLTNAR